MQITCNRIENTSTMKITVLYTIEEIKPLLSKSFDTNLNEYEKLLVNFMRSFSKKGDDALSYKPIDPVKLAFNLTQQYLVDIVYYINTRSDNCVFEDDLSIDFDKLLYVINNNLGPIQIVNKDIYAYTCSIQMDYIRKFNIPDKLTKLFKSEIPNSYYTLNMYLEKMKSDLFKIVHDKNLDESYRHSNSMIKCNSLVNFKYFFTDPNGAIYLDINGKMYYSNSIDMGAPGINSAISDALLGTSPNKNYQIKIKFVPSMIINPEITPIILAPHLYNKNLDLTLNVFVFENVLVTNNGYTNKTIRQITSFKSVTDYENYFTRVYNLIQKFRFFELNMLIITSKIYPYFRNKKFPLNTLVLDAQCNEANYIQEIRNFTNTINSPQFFNTFNDCFHNQLGSISKYKTFYHLVYNGFQQKITLTQLIIENLIYIVQRQLGNRIHDKFKIEDTDEFLNEVDSLIDELIDIFKYQALNSDKFVLLDDITEAYAIFTLIKHNATKSFLYNKVAAQNEFPWLNTEKFDVLNASNYKKSRLCKIICRINELFNFSIRLFALVCPSTDEFCQYRSASLRAYLYANSIKF
ncbi:MAG: hypothetical protein LBF68_06835 [Christensenellaceae bacterium]|jgi:hypothetical protein|nr:hypothetical protein [Christensenellaceae bacterium]